jgi:SAM-dependent methyltransferase
MSRVRPYLPLIGFVIPTVVIGYGVVIPRSCIAGVNALSLGFGTTILGAILAYVSGQRVARPPAACSKPSLWVRLSRAINRQAASPSGMFGRFLGMVWRREHARLNGEVLDALELGSGHHILEVGSGPGEALRAAARRSPGGAVLGLDVSELMVKLARRRNRNAVNRGLVEVRQVDGVSLGLNGRSFDRILSVHSIYFWRDVEAMLGQLASSLRPGGRIVLAFRPEDADIPLRFRDPTYRFPRPERLEAVLRRFGLEVLRSSPSNTAAPAHVLVAERSRNGQAGEGAQDLT